MRKNETRMEIVKTLLYIGMIPLVAGLLFLYVWIGEEVRASAVRLNELKAREIKLRAEYNLVQSERNRLQRPDNLSRLAQEQIGLVQPDPEPRKIKVPVR